MAPDISLLTVGMTAGVSALTAIVTVWITSALARRREHEGDWRKLKLAQYQEYIAALSGVVVGRVTPEAQRRYADAVNAMVLIASVPVLNALRAFQAEISFMNEGRSITEHDKILDVLVRVMREDVQPASAHDNPDWPFRLLGLPPESDT